ncbi:magnetosome protein MamQ [Magnetovibrio sp. PR-2]|uniref:magnetosome protein MamQ n=1 Tax=Magnetovibrio sp. PR-2 TaxID=3120356 RepID=UPI002FCE40AC
MSILDRTINNDKQRLRRSEALLNQLYREEVDPPFQAPALRGVKVMALLSVLAILIFTGTLFFKFNNFIYLHEDVLNKRGNLEASLQRRSNLFTNMVNLTLNHAALEHTIFAYTSKARSGVVNKNEMSPDVKADLIDRAEQLGKSGILPEGWEEALEGFKNDGGGAALGRLMAVVEKYPDIKSAQTYQEMMTSLVEMEDKITMRRNEYNQTLHTYNTAIMRFPWKLLADWTGFERYDYFTVKNPGITAPIISADTYKELVPFIDEGTKQ